ncbi:hypothetical protein M0741_25075, partial [Salmonella enterica subsp. enterica serovar Oranienburg]|nr:hypothetical protein [Salmonella enterica subsp. enterica serovar Oranienburg]
FKEAQHNGHVPPGYNPALATKQPRNRVTYSKKRNITVMSLQAITLPWRPSSRETESLVSVFLWKSGKLFMKLPISKNRTSSVECCSR